MRPNIKSHKRTDYSRLSPRRNFSAIHTIDGIGVVRKSPNAPIKTKYKEPVVTHGINSVHNNAKKDVKASSKDVKMQFSMPSFRQPPGMNEAPSKQSLKWVLIVAIGLIFFVFGYHNLWHMLNKSTAVLLFRSL